VGYAFGIGVGYSLPVSLETPNTTSVRVRFPSGLTIEPRVAVSNSSTSINMTGAPGTTDTITELNISGLVHKTLIQHGRYDFEILGGAAIDVTKNDPDGDNNTKTTTELGLVWGIGVNAWLSPHWQLSFDVQNPLVDYVSTKQETGPGMDMTTSTTNIGVVFAPIVAMMIHLYD
jgi:hypothetical protein